MPPKIIQTNLRKDLAIKIPKDSNNNKRQYSLPMLFKYGELAIVTAGGTAGVPEGPSSSPNKQRP